MEKKFVKVTIVEPQVKAIRCGGGGACNETR